MSFRSEIFFDGQWLEHGFRFATEEEAAAYGRFLKYGPHRAVQSTDPVNYAYKNARLSPVTPEPFNPFEAYQ
jgi:hypothetical protein